MQTRPASPRIKHTFSKRPRRGILNPIDSGMSTTKRIKSMHTARESTRTQEEDEFMKSILDSSCYRTREKVYTLYLC